MPVQIAARAAFARVQALALHHNALRAQRQHARDFVAQHTVVVHLSQRGLIGIDLTAIFQLSNVGWCHIRDGKVQAHQPVE